MGGSAIREFLFEVRRADEKELLNLMRDGAYQICEYAVTQWTADKYKMGEAMRQKMIKEWKYKKQDVGTLYSKIARMLDM